MSDVSMALKFECQILSLFDVDMLLHKPIKLSIIGDIIIKLKGDTSN